jgi:hypothetical protein
LPCKPNSNTIGACFSLSKKNPLSSDWFILSTAVHTIHGYEYPSQTHAMIIYICFSKLTLGGNQKYLSSKISLTTLTNCF